MSRMSLARRIIPIVVLTIAYPLLHTPVSDAFDWASGRWGFSAYQLGALVGIPAVCALAVLPLLVRRRHDLVAPRRLGALLALALATAASQHWLMVVRIELIHLPQFAIVSAAALGRGYGANAAFLIGTASGIVDETYQHLVVYAGRAGTYFDVNDIVLNALGAAWGILLFASSTREARVDGEPGGAADRGPRLPWRGGSIRRCSVPVRRDAREPEVLPCAVGARGRGVVRGAVAGGRLRALRALAQLQAEGVRVTLLIAGEGAAQRPSHASGRRARAPGARPVPRISAGCRGRARGW